MLPRHLPRFDQIQPLETDLEDLNSTMNTFLSLASHEKPVLDRRQAAAASSAAPP
jgi:hypothetical protein